MGREVRRVPPNWKHPKKVDGYTCKEEYQPLFDEDAQTAWNEWFTRYTAWISGEFARKCKEYPEWHPDEPYRAFCEWHGQPPDPESCRPRWAEGEATWWQVYETVSEGTPVTPPFATPEELIDYLATHGDFWDQRRGNGPWKRESAERFVQAGWAPTLMMTIPCDCSGLPPKIQKPRDS